ncbi:DNA glycosylase [Mycotypha africana]|uniref:DNA glycosylase n=1 Tax=Mycotypha africana TaxID=64632 RepID=UPI0023001114|nr:DNA glycosylase [Mycotypha africana]KAI8988347.1 DNA glycosylase [Mycotypha africana]
MSILKINATHLLWKDLCISPHELRLKTLHCGQSFRWRQYKDQWISTLKGNLIILKETPSSIMIGYPSEEDETSKKEKESILKDYFQLDKVSLKSCYDSWSKIDQNFAEKAVDFQGIRILRQDPWENLISFICSSNNNITRISQMIHKLCTQFGQKIAIVDDQEEFYDFPSLEALLADEEHRSTEKVLRDLGFGYRAKYIVNTAKFIKENYPEQGQRWLNTLREKPYLEAKEALMQLQGVGPKVADCICLMSLDHPEAIPVDTHVWQIALRDYGFKNKGKALNHKLYLQVGDHLRAIFGDYSGWAHSVLFTADLKSFKIVKKTVETTIQEEEGTQHTQITKKRKKITVETSTTTRVKKRASF